eukprot:TRINITY_DN5606_c0_g1_i4.p1 TRINITY_DN5606_c0_g1~~TRINITY_DN5606_c0_g1_i4.p1  ORF type:complete len:178 (-),score=41.29 TRINITY_DN5606_c0_g1_i4:78-611(-)
MKSKISFNKLKERGYQGIVFDCDNTLTPPYVPAFHPEFKVPIENCSHLFPGRVLIYSNSAGSNSDKDFENAILLEQNLRLPVLRHTHQKPEGIEEVLQHFKGIPPKDLVMIGDRYATDIVFGNLNGMLTIHTKPFTSKGENQVVKMIRKLEDIVVGILYKSKFRREAGLPITEKEEL